MSIYLAWSVYKLIGALLFVALTTAILLYTGKKQDSIKNYKKVTFALSGIELALILLMAFNVGDRQQELGRSNFNASAPQTVDKIETNQQNIDSVKQAFEQAVSK